MSDGRDAMVDKRLAEIERALAVCGNGIIGMCDKLSRSYRIVAELRDTVRRLEKENQK